ncbi:hypothetical protein WKQ82_000620, partial [Escherichia coli]
NLVNCHETGKSEIRKEALHSRSDVFHAFCVAGYGGNALCSGCLNDAIKKGSCTAPRPEERNLITISELLSRQNNGIQNMS